MPRQWWPSTDAMRAMLESPGPWPSPSPGTNGSFVPLDVDLYDGLAIVVGYGPGRHGREVMGVDEFERTTADDWRHLGGGGSGGRGLDERQLLVLWTPDDRAQLDAYAANGTRSFRWAAPGQGRL